MDYEDLTFKVDEDLNLMLMPYITEQYTDKIKSPSNRTRILNYNELLNHFNLIKNTLYIKNAVIKDGVIIDYTIQHQENLFQITSK